MRSKHTYTLQHRSNQYVRPAGSGEISTLFSLEKNMIKKAIALSLALVGTVDAQTYTQEVADIINNNCVVCHRQGGIGPMSFETYEQVRPWAPLIQMKVASREMPPYAYDHGIGIQDLQGDWRLKQEEIDTIVNWVAAGSPYGDPDTIVQAPPLRDPEAWNFEADFGAPDAIIPSVAIDALPHRFPARVVNFTA